MKRLLVVLSLVCILTACEDKPVSKEYYQDHLDEARTQIIKCQKDKSENSINCDNARLAIRADLAKKYEDKISNSLR